MQQELTNEDVVCSGSLFTNSNWFAFDEDKPLNDGLVSSEASPSPNSEMSALKEDDENDEVILGEEVMDDTKGSEPPLPVPNKDANEESGHTGLANGTIDTLEDDIRPPTPDVKESQPEFVEWKEEEAERGDVAEKDTAVLDMEVESEKQLDSMDCDAKFGEEKNSDDMLGSSVSETEAASPVSSDIDSIKHPEPVADSAVSEYPMGEQNPEK